MNEVLLSILSGIGGFLIGVAILKIRWAIEDRRDRDYYRERFPPLKQ